MRSLSASISLSNSSGCRLAGRSLTYIRGRTGLLPFGVGQRRAHIVAAVRAIKHRIGQRVRPADRRRELAVDLRTGLDRLAVGEAVEHLLEALGGQILVGVVPDQNHRG